MSLRPMAELTLDGAPEAMRSGVSADALGRWNPRVAAAADSDNTITILDPIGEDLWGEGVTVKRIAAALRRIGEGPVVVDINSPGGDVFEGIAIYNALRLHPGRVSVRVLGLAASAASIIAMAGDSIAMPETAFLMIHNTWTIALGDRHVMREVADFLEPFDSAMAGVYSDRAGIKRATVAKWLDDEKWMSGAEAVEVGLADTILEPAAVTSEAGARAAVPAIRQVEAALCEKGFTRSQRRSLLGEISGGMPGAVSRTDDPEWIAAMQALVREVEART